MENFPLINNERLQHGYTTGHLRSYKRYCNNMKQLYSNKDTNLHLLYSLEANLAKFKLIGSMSYLYKNLRLLRKESDAFACLYTQYIHCFIDYKKRTASIDSLIGLRNSLADFYSFLDDIYTISDNRHDFEQYKVRYQWNDVTVIFETQKALESFLDGTFVLHDFRFNTQLAQKILCVEKRFKAFINTIADTEASVATTFDAASDLFTSISILDKYLSDNFVESEHVSLLKSSCSQVLDFLRKIMEFQVGVIHPSIDEFQVPEMFSCVGDSFEALKSKKRIKPSKLRSMLVDVVEKRIEVDDKHRSMPFLPVFYDLAYDFIGYSTQETSVAGLLRGFNFFNKK